MTPMRHALTARMLIKACGGLEESAAACRLEKSQLANFQDAERVQDPARAQFMPADVIDDLEAMCGRQIYSRALLDERAGKDQAATLMGEACNMVEASSAALKRIAEASADGVITPAERKSIDQALLNLAQLVARCSAVNAPGGGS